MGAVTLVQGVTGAGLNGTQTPISNASNAAASQAFVNQQIAFNRTSIPFQGVTGGFYNQNSLGTGLTFVIFVNSSPGPVSSVLSIVTGGTGFVTGDILTINGGNYDAVLRVTNAVAGVVQSGGLAVVYGGSGYMTGLQTTASFIPPGNRFIPITGVLTSNLVIAVAAGPALLYTRSVIYANSTTGAFTVSVFLSNGAGGTTGTGVVLTQGANNSTAQLTVTDGVTDIWKVA